MQKKLQVFVSSTYSDLITERQNAVKAILNAGHIPAGMELFAVGDESQQEVITRWIEESDAYLLILGGRYGSLTPKKDKSYTHWEYDYAGQIGKPRFVILLSEKFLQEKVNASEYKKILEQDNPLLHKKFVESIKTNKFVSIVDDLKDIEITILKSLREIEKNEKVSGWISAKNMPNFTEISKIYTENTRLKSKIQKLSTENKLLNEKMTRSNKNDLIYNGFNFEEVLEVLQSELEIPEFLQEEIGSKSLSIVRLFCGYQRVFINGSINNASGMTDQNKFLFRKISPHLLKFDLVEKKRAVGQRYDEINITKNGLRFIAIYERDHHPKKSKKAE